MTRIATTALTAFFFAVPLAGLVPMNDTAMHRCNPIPAAFDRAGFARANQDRKTCISHIAERA